MIVSVDAAQLEWRVALELSQDQTGINEVINKLDAHSLNQKAFSLPSRIIAKIYLFRTIFRGSGWSFANDPDFMHVSTSAKFWDDVGVKFYKKYNGLDTWHKELADIVMRREPLVTPLGREFLINNRDKKGEIFVPWTLLTNYPVQGTAADIMSIARVSFSNRFKKAGFKGKIIQTVHDDIKTDVPDNEVQDVAVLFHEVFRDLIQNIKKLFGYSWTVPLACETKIGMNMMDMKELKVEL